MIELVGYIGSALVAVSLLMSNVLRLRVINLAGSLIFVFYGIFLKAYAVAIANLFVVFVDIYYIYSLRSRKDIFKFIKTNCKDKLLKYFLSYNGQDIMSFFPRFSDSDIENAECFLIMRNLSAVGAFIFVREDKTIRVILDYIITDYRDLKNARCFYNSSQAAEEFSGFEKIVAETDNPAHSRYLKLMGFSPNPSNAMLFEKKL